MSSIEVSLCFWMPEMLACTSGFHLIGPALQALSKAGQVAQAFAAAGNNCPQDPQDPCHHLYVRSHEAYGAGEQKDRHYNWASPNIDPAEHVFGELLPDKHISTLRRMKRICIRPYFHFQVNGGHCINDSAFIVEAFALLFNNVYPAQQHALNAFTSSCIFTSKLLEAV